MSKKVFVLVTLVCVLASFVSIGCSFLGDGSDDGNSDDVTAGLIGRYPFDGNANDESGNGNHGTLHGGSVQFVSGVFHQAVHFDNSKSGTFTVNDYVELPPISVDQLSVAHWVKFISGSSTSYSGSTYSIGEYPSRQFRIVIRNDGVLLGQIVVNDHYYNTPEVDVSDHDWHFIAVTVDKENIRVYHNGSEIGSESLGFPLGFVNSYQYVALHRFNGDMSSRFTGELDNLRVYSRTLSPSDIFSLYSE